MGVSLTLQHTKELGAGRYEYRRRVPQSVKASLGQNEFKRVFSAASPAALAREHSRIDAEFERLVSGAKRSSNLSKLTPREAAEVAKEEAARLLAGVHGPDDEDEARDILAESLIQTGAPREVYMAVVQPNAELPAHTLEDARKLYVQEKLGGGGSEHRDATNRIDRVMGRVKEALGEDFTKKALGSLKRADARKVRDYMLQTKRNGGGTLSAGTVRRELNTLSAVINFGLEEFELNNVVNPFNGLAVTGVKGNGAVQTEAEKRDSLPSDVIAAMSARLSGDLQLIWRMLAGTGCRLAEVAGLRVSDVILSGPVPHINIAWHAGRSLKTQSSVRLVPLVGDALLAAEAALKLAEGETMLFPRYARPRGMDALSQVLNAKHLRTITTNPKHVVHSLRHNMKDALRLADVEKVVQDLILGHAPPSVGEIYGSEAAKLKVLYRAMIKVADAK